MLSFQYNGAPATYPNKVIVTIDTDDAEITRYRKFDILITVDHILHEHSFLLLSGKDANELAVYLEKMIGQFFPMVKVSSVNNLVHIQPLLGSTIHHVAFRVKGSVEPDDPPGWVVWPNSLPTCVSSWSEAPLDPRIRSKMDVGREKTRRRFTGILRNIEVGFILANNDGGVHEQVTAFRLFFEGPGDSASHTGGTDGGYHWFLFESPVDQSLHFYRFIKPPSFTNQGPLIFSAKMTWEEYI